jgi:AcrR family transcriptional regulator
MMLPMAEPVKRQYRSTARAAAATATRARIRGAATELFVRQGYASTTLKQVAALAGVGERTLYDAFPNKAALFQHTLNVAVGGDEQKILVADRPEVRATRKEPDPRAAIAQAVANTVAILERAGDLIMVSVEAAGADPYMRETADKGSTATHKIHLALTTELHKRGSLRSGLDPVTAADILYLLLSPHTHHMLRRRRGWSRERYQTWIEKIVTAELLRS